MLCMQNIIIQIMDESRCWYWGMVADEDIDVPPTIVTESRSSGNDGILERVWLESSLPVNSIMSNRLRLEWRIKSSLHRGWQMQQQESQTAIFN